MLSHNPSLLFIPQFRNCSKFGDLIFHFVTALPDPLGSKNTVKKCRYLNSLAQSSPKLNKLPSVINTQHIVHPNLVALVSLLQRHLSIIFSLILAILIHSFYPCAVAQPKIFELNFSNYNFTLSQKVSSFRPHLFRNLSGIKLPANMDCKKILSTALEPAILEVAPSDAEFSPTPRIGKRRRSNLVGYRRRKLGVPRPRTSLPTTLLTVIPSTATLPIDFDAPPSPGFQDNPLFEDDRLRFIGYEKPDQEVQHLLDIMPYVRQIWIFLNVRLSPGKISLSSGFCSGADMVTKIFPILDSSITSLVQFTSRSEVSLYLHHSCFSIFLSMQGFNWLLLAPFPICQIIQNWASENSEASEAIIKSSPTISAAYTELSLSMVEGAKMVFLTDYDREPIGQLSDQGHEWPRLPPNLPTGMSRGFHEPVSMLITAPPYPENRTANRRIFQVIWADQNHRLRHANLEGLPSLRRFTAAPGLHFVIPFPERVHKHSLAFLIMQALPDCGWPVIKLSATSILEEITSLAVLAPSLSSNSSDPNTRRAARDRYNVTN